ncbi:ABC transporter substrate binding protein [Roseibium sp.]|uniref:ABC transporter substrate binding protein n=1 Tax=Roseibium sp. TaxID=1936156 RepID=UPI003BA90FC6
MQLLRIFLFACLALITGTTFAADQKHIQLITWRGMTSAEQGFLSRLAEHGLQAKYDHFDAGRSETKLAGFLRANRSELEKRDLIYTFGTTATLTVKNFDMEGVPTVFNIVSDPIGSGITLSMEMPTGGITGAKLSLSAEVILQLLEQVHPYTTVAILFDPRETNSTVEADKATVLLEILEKRPIRLRYIPDVENSMETLRMLKADLAAADVIYVTSSSSFTSPSDVLRKILPDDKVSVSSSPALVDLGGTIAFGENYWERGEAAADLAAKILLGEHSPGDIPINEIKANESVAFINESSPLKDKLDLSAFSGRVEYR